MNCIDLKKWFDLHLIPDNLDIFYVVYGEQGRSNVFCKVEDINIEWRDGRLVIVLHPEKIKFKETIVK
jgi:hypothetical protein